MREPNGKIKAEEATLRMIKGGYGVGCREGSAAALYCDVKTYGDITRGVVTQIDDNEGPMTGDKPGLAVHGPRFDYPPSGVPPKPSAH